MMDSVYKVKLDKLLGTTTSNHGCKGEDSTISVWNSVPEKFHDCLHLIDWSHNGLIAVAVNTIGERKTRTSTCNNDSSITCNVSGGDNDTCNNVCIQQPVVALFDCNEPHMVSLISPSSSSQQPRSSSSLSSSTSTSANNVLETSSNEQSFSEDLSHSKNDKMSAVAAFGQDVNGWLMSGSSIYAHVLWHPNQQYLATVTSGGRNNCAIEIWTNETTTFLINDFDIHISASWNHQLLTHNNSSLLNSNNNKKYQIQQQETVFPVTASWINVEFEHIFKKIPSQNSGNSSEDTIIQGGSTESGEQGGNKENVFMSAKKLQALFGANENSDTDDKDCGGSLLHELSYPFAFGVVTSNAKLLVVVYNQYGDSIRASSNIIQSSYSQSTITSSSIPFKSSKCAQSEVLSAKFSWERASRFVSLISSDGTLRIVKYQLKLSDTAYNNNFEQLCIKVETVHIINLLAQQISPASSIITSSSTEVFLAARTKPQFNRDPKSSHVKHLNYDVKMCEDDKSNVLTNQDRCGKDEHVRIVKYGIPRKHKLGSAEKLTSNKGLKTEIKDEPNFEGALSALENQSFPDSETVNKSIGDHPAMFKKEDELLDFDSKELLRSVKEEPTAQKTATSSSDENLSIVCFTEVLSGNVNVMASNLCLFDQKMYENNDNHFIVVDSNSTKVFETRELSEISSKLDSTSSKKDRRGAVKSADPKKKRKYCLSPMGFAVAYFDPETWLVEVSLLGSMTQLGLAVNGGDEDREGGVINEKNSGSSLSANGEEADAALVSRFFQLLITACCANKDFWDLFFVFKRRMSSSSVLTKRLVQLIYNKKWPNVFHHRNRMLFFCSLVTNKLTSEQAVSPLSSFGFSMELTLTRLLQLFKLIFQAADNRSWKKLDMFLQEPVPNLSDSLILSEFEVFLIKEAEFMLFLPLVQHIYDQTLRLFTCVLENRHEEFVNFGKILELNKQLLFFTTMWVIQPSVRPKHYPVFEKYVPNIDMLQFFNLNCQILFLTSSSCDGGESTSFRQHSERYTREQVFTNLASFMRFFRPYEILPTFSNSFSGVYNLSNRTKPLTFGAIHIEKPATQVLPPAAGDSLNDDVRFLKLGVRPVTNYKLCSRCGRKISLRAKKQFKWPLWEALWNSRCVCGGSWRRQNMGAGDGASKGSVSASSQITVQTSGSAKSTSSITPQGDNK